MPDELELMLSDCLRFCFDCHLGQYRNGPGGAPYFVHPLKVSERLGLWGIGRRQHPELWIAGWGHDLEEDCGVTEDQIAERANRRVAQIITELSFRSQHADESREDYRLAKKNHLASYAEKSTAATVIKCADRIENTLDFLSEQYTKLDSRSCYAVQYWNDAEGLFQAVTKHSGEIIRHYGKETLRRMTADLERVEVMLTPYL